MINTNRLQTLHSEVQTLYPLNQSWNFSFFLGCFCSILNKASLNNVSVVSFRSTG